jgi:hypothetical protein
LKFAPAFGVSLLSTPLLSQLTCSVNLTVELVDADSPQIQGGKFRYEVTAHRQRHQLSQTEVSRFWIALPQFFTDEADTGPCVRISGLFDPKEFR